MSSKDTTNIGRDTEAGQAQSGEREFPLSTRYLRGEVLSRESAGLEQMGCWGPAAAGWEAASQVATGVNRAWYLARAEWCMRRADDARKPVSYLQMAGHEPDPHSHGLNAEECASSVTYSWDEWTEVRRLYRGLANEATQFERLKSWSAAADIWESALDVAIGSNIHWARHRHAWCVARASSPNW